MSLAAGAWTLGAREVQGLQCPQRLNPRCAYRRNPALPLADGSASVSPLVQAIQRSERELAGSDSRFFEVDGIHLHYKRCTPAAVPGGTAGAASAVVGAGAGGLGAAVVASSAAVEAAEERPTAVHCLHGFGASCYR